MKWQDKLTKKELKHMKDIAGCHSLKTFKENRKGQIQMRESGKFDREPCFDCRSIALKLGLED